MCSVKTNQIKHVTVKWKHILLLNENRYRLPLNQDQCSVGHSFFDICPNLNFLDIFKVACRLIIRDLTILSALTEKETLNWDIKNWIFGTKTNFQMDNAMVTFLFTVFDTKHLFGQV